MNSIVPYTVENNTTEQIKNTQRLLIINWTALLRKGCALDQSTRKISIISPQPIIFVQKGFYCAYFTITEDQQSTQVLSSCSSDSTWCENAVTSPNEFGDVTKFCAKSCEGEENAWVLGWLETVLRFTKFFGLYFGGILLWKYYLCVLPRDKKTA